MLAIHRRHATRRAYEDIRRQARNHLRRLGRSATQGAIDQEISRQWYRLSEEVLAMFWRDKCRQRKRTCGSELE